MQIYAGKKGKERKGENLGLTSLFTKIFVLLKKQNLCLLNGTVI